ncbi:MAG: AmmeMemoRadiSam system protein A, partial [Solobacterium sp.]|nr:AmmeMemoRadiSam system protein A [Solobacterium sp.]
GTMVPLYFVEKYYSDFKILRIGLSGLSFADHYRFGMMIREAVKRTGRRAVLIASGDLSHKLQEYGPYGFAKEGPQYDERIMDVMGSGEFGKLFEFSESFCDKAAECGHRSFVIMAGAFDGLQVKAQAYSHQDVTGVGYGICSFYPQETDESRHFLNSYLAKEEERLAKQKEDADPYVRLARKSLESWILKREIIAAGNDIPEEMKSRRAGTFVSIHKDGKLRGCIGTISPVYGCVADEIIHNAISASSRDPRFSPIRADELKWLEISVDVLGEPEPIESVNELDVKRYGVIVTCGARRGLLLPDLEGVDTVEDQVAIAMNKAGIHSWETPSLERFEVIRHI